MKTWCKHIKWESWEGRVGAKYVNPAYHFEFFTVVTDDWKLCPICLKKRPKALKQTKG